MESSGFSRESRSRSRSAERLASDIENSSGPLEESQNPSNNGSETVSPRRGRRNDPVDLPWRRPKSISPAALIEQPPLSILIPDVQSEESLDKPRDQNIFVIQSPQIARSAVEDRQNLEAITIEGSDANEPLKTMSKERLGIFNRIKEKFPTFNPPKCNLMLMDLDCSCPRFPNSPFTMERLRNFSKTRSFLILVISLPIVIILLAFLLWPRMITIDVEASKEPTSAKDDFQIVTINGMITINVTDNLDAIIKNKNFVPAQLQKANVTAYWVMKSGKEILFGSGGVNKGDHVGAWPLITSKVKIPYSIEFTGDPRSDELYLDFLERCTEGSEDKRKVAMHFKISTSLKALFSRRESETEFDHEVPCPMDLQQIKTILTAAKVNLKDPKFSKLASNVKGHSNIKAKELNMSIWPHL